MTKLRPGTECIPDPTICSQARLSTPEAIGASTVEVTNGCPSAWHRNRAKRVILSLQISETEANNPDARRVCMNWSTTGPGLANDHWKRPGEFGFDGSVI